MTFPVVYEKATGASKGPTPGARALMTWALSLTAPVGTNLGIYNVRAVRGSKTVWSVHAEGRAIDVGFPVQPQGHAEGHRLAGLLVQHHAALGVQQVIWARQIWRNTIGSWRPYNGVSPHLDHVHAELTRAAAAGLTTDLISLATWPRPPKPPTPPGDPMAPMDMLGIIAYVDLCYQAAGRPADADAVGRRYWVEQAAQAESPWPTLAQMWSLLAPGK